MPSESLPSSNVVVEPIPVFKVAHKYMVYDVNHVTHLRANHNILGVLIGTLPQAPMQNVFSGIPLELMPEEARLLCEKGVAYIVDDTQAHKTGFLGKGGEGLSPEERRKFQDAMRKQGQAAAGEVGKKAEERKKAGLAKKFGTDNWNDIPEDMFTPTSSRPASRAGVKKKKGRRDPGEVNAAEATSSTTAVGDRTPNGEEGTQLDEDEMLFGAPSTSAPPGKPAASGSRPPPPTTGGSSGPDSLAITPTTSYPPLTATPPQADGATSELPNVPSSYPLYRHLHEKDYFMSPGLRFGCQYTAYPGDPLRFHSHFLCNGMDWDQEFDLQDLVGGGRLGTGVKKGFLVGGEEKAASGRNDGTGGVDEDDTSRAGVRTFCVEWGGM